MKKNQPESEHDKKVHQESLLRKVVREKNLTCPVCGESGVGVYGGAGSWWFEHRCGSYSPLAKTWELAYEAWCENPQAMTLPEGTQMFPPIGG
jgi:hypothetical protein